MSISVVPNGLSVFAALLTDSEKMFLHDLIDCMTMRVKIRMYKVYSVGVEDRDRDRRCHVISTQIRKRI